MSKTKFYHCSPKRFKKGDTLVCPASKGSRNYSCWGIDGVFLNTSEIPHFTIWDKIDKNWHVYEVTPVGKLTYGIWDDIICKSAIVKRRVGSAKGILDKYKAKRKPYGDGGDVLLTEDAYVHRKRFERMKKKW